MASVVGLEIFTKLAPEAVEHEFGGGLPSWVLDNEVGIEVDAFSLLVLPHVLSFVCGSSGPGGVAGGFLFNFEPGVNVGCTPVRRLSRSQGCTILLGGYVARGCVDSDEISPAGVFPSPLPYRLDRVGT